MTLKLTHATAHTDRMLRRFEAERQALALMNHPNIAQVYDAGSTERGEPQFVMEYVDGVSITAFCDSNRCDIRQRLALMVKVCEGVQHAHRKGIVHRDLEPSNVFVTGNGDTECSLDIPGTVRSGEPVKRDSKPYNLLSTLLLPTGVFLWGSFAILLEDQWMPQAVSTGGCPPPPSFLSLCPDEARGLHPT